jgi:hypothetical protein
LTDTNGLDVLVAWSGYAVLIIALLVFLLRPSTSDAVREANCDTEDVRREQAHDLVTGLPGETALGNADPASRGPQEPRFPEGTT